MLNKKEKGLLLGVILSFAIGLAGFFLPIGDENLGARTATNWLLRDGTYLEPADPNGYDILISGTDRYLNFNSLSGVDGYGFRDNSGTMEVKSDSGTWLPIATAAGSMTPLPEGFVYVGDSTNTAEATSSLYIHSTGNVGIGTTTNASSSKLVVDGSIFTDFVEFYNNTDNPPYKEGYLFYDKTKNALSYYNDEADITVNIAQEHLIPVYNNTGDTIENCKVAYPSGTFGGATTLGLADASKKDKSRLIAVTTHSIEDSTLGYVTRLGEVGGCNTAGLSGVVYLSPTNPGELTMTRPDDGAFVITVGTIAVADAVNGVLNVDPSISELAVEVTDTNGFPPSERATTTVTFDDSTRTFSITPISDEFHYYQLGEKFEQTSAVSTTTPDEDGLYAFYFNEENLEYIKTPSDGQVDQTIRTRALVAYMYWDATANEHLYLGDERHGISMSPDTHSYLHFTRGIQWLSGIALNSVLPDEDGSSDSHAQFGNDSGFATDEDLLSVISASSSPTTYPLFYLSGTDPDVKRIYNSGFPVLDDVTAGVGATGRLVYNQLSGSTWSLTTVANTDFVLSHVFATNDPNQPIIVIIGQGDYSTIGQAQAGANTELSSIATIFPQEELLPIATVIFQTRDTYTNSVKARIRLTDTGADYVDWRFTELQAGSAPSSHPNLSSLLWTDAGHTGTASTFAGFDGSGLATNYTPTNGLAISGTNLQPDTGYEIPLTASTTEWANTAMYDGTWKFNIGSSTAASYGATNATGTILLSDLPANATVRQIWCRTETSGVSGLKAFGTYIECDSDGENTSTITSDTATAFTEYSASYYHNYSGSPLQTAIGIRYTWD